MPLWLAARFFIRTKPPNVGQIVVVQPALVDRRPRRGDQYFDLGLHGRVQASDIVVLGRVVDPALALVSVERVFKGEAPKQITLVAYVDGFAVPAHLYRKARAGMTMSPKKPATRRA